MADALVHRRLPVQVLGVGQASAVAKLAHVVHVLRLESGDTESFNKLRRSVRHFCSDQGTERLIERCPNINGSLPELMKAIEAIEAGDTTFFEQADAYLFPLALAHPGHLHICYNSLESSVTGIKCWKSLEADLRVLTAFFGNRGMRRRFIHQCLPRPLRKLFSVWSSRHIDWKWEFLSGLLDSLVPRLPALIKHFDLSKMSTAEGRQGSLSSQLLPKVAAIIARGDEVLCLCEGLRVLAKSVDRVAHWFEGCGCHGELRTETRSYKKRRRLVAESLAAAGSHGACCPWHGRRGCEVALGQARHLLDWIARASSDYLQSLLMKLDEQARASILADIAAVKAAIGEELAAKLGYHQQLPWRLLGGFGEHFGLAAEARACMRQCIIDFDEDRQHPLRGKQLHRIAVRVLGVGTVFRQQAENYAHSDLPLSSFPELFVELQVLALSPLVERRVEAIHASIKAECRASHGILPGLVCAKMRASETLAAQDDPEALAGMCAIWKQRGALQRLLSFGQDRCEAMPVTKLYSRVYGYDLDMQHRSRVGDQCVVDAWESSLRATSMSMALALPATTRFTIEFLKDLMVPGRTFCIPLQCAADCVFDVGPSVRRMEDCPPVDISSLTALVDDRVVRPLPPDDVQGPGGEDLVGELEPLLCRRGWAFFRVVNPAPEARTLHHSLGQPLPKTLVHVQELHLDSVHHNLASAEMALGSSRALALDLYRLMFVAGMPGLFRKMVFWEVWHSARLIVKRAPLSDIAMCDQLVPIESAAQPANPLLAIQDRIGAGCPGALW